MTHEEWRALEKYKNVEISNTGKVRRLTDKQERKAIKNKKGYLVVSLRTAGESGKWSNFRVHQLVLEAFNRPRQGSEQCRHLDGNAANNNLDNLRWGTAEENLMDKLRHGRVAYGLNHKDSQLTDEIVAAIRILYVPGDRAFGARSLACRLGVSPTTIREALHGKTWKHVPLLETIRNNAQIAAQAAQQVADWKERAELWDFYLSHPYAVNQVASGYQAFDGWSYTQSVYPTMEAAFKESKRMADALRAAREASDE